MAWPTSYHHPSPSFAADHPIHNRVMTKTITVIVMMMMMLTMVVVLQMTRCQIFPLPPFAIHILNRLDMRIYQEASKLYHTYTNNWVHRDRLIRVFFWQYFVISELGCQNCIVKSALLICWVFLLIFFGWNHIDNTGRLEPFLPLWEHWNRVSVQLNCTSDLTPRHMLLCPETAFVAIYAPFSGNIPIL